MICCALSSSAGGEGHYSGLEFRFGLFFFREGGEEKPQSLHISDRYGILKSKETKGSTWALLASQISATHAG